MVSVEFICRDYIVCFEVTAFRCIIPSLRNLKLILYIIRKNPCVTFEVLTAVNIQSCCFGL